MVLFIKHSNCTFQVKNATRTPWLNYSLANTAGCRFFCMKITSTSQHLQGLHGSSKGSNILHNLSKPSLWTFKSQELDACMLVTQSCPTLCNPMNCSSPGCSVHRILQARTLEWVAVSFLGDLPNPGIELGSPAWQGGFFTIWATREALRRLY